MAFSVLKIEFIVIIDYLVNYDYIVFMPLDNRFAVPIAEGLLIESETKHRRIHGVHGNGLKGIAPLIERTLHTRLSTDSIVKTHTLRRDSPHALHGSIARGQSASRRKALSALFCRATTGRT